MGNSYALRGPRSTSTQLTLQPLKHRRKRRQNVSRHRRTACYDIRHDPIRYGVMGTNYLRLRFLRERCGSAAKGNTSAAEPDGRQQVMAALQQGSELPTWRECARLWSFELPKGFERSRRAVTLGLETLISKNVEPEMYEN